MNEVAPQSAPKAEASDTLRILAARGLRAFGDGYVPLLVPIYLLELGFSALEIGVIVTSTLIGTALVTLWAGIVANRYSVRRLLLAAALLMAATGAGFAATTAFWPLLLIAFVGTMNPTSGDASIFLPLEQAALAQTAEPRRRTAVFARYSVIGSAMGALGILAASMPDFAEGWGVGRIAVMQLMFIGYAMLGLISLALYRPLSPAIEAEATSHKPLGPSKRLVYGLAALFGMDSFGTGFLVQSLLALWLYQRFQISVTAAAAILFWSGICSAVSYLIAVPIAARIGLIQHDGVHPPAIEHFIGVGAVRAESNRCDRAAVGAQRLVADGCADPQLLCHGGCCAGGAAGGGQHYAGTEDLRPGRPGH